MKILILHHQLETFADRAFLLKRFAEHWLEQGHRVLAANHCDNLPDADVAILHVDTTEVEQKYLDAMEKFPLTINAGVGNISKELYSNALVTQESDYAGKVIVKTRANFGGLSEYDKAMKEKKQKGHIDPDIPWEDKEYLLEYPVFDTIQDVPSGVWNNDKLMVEKFLPEKLDEETYQLRIWIFFGDHEIHYRNFSSDPIIKNRNVSGYEMLDNDDVPEELRAVRAQLNMDYGKFDYVLHDGKPILYDVNKTPNGGKPKPGDKQIANNIKYLSEGLQSLFAQLD